jgi:hypothetical protein
VEVNEIDKILKVSKWNAGVSKTLSEIVDELEKEKK